MFLALTSINGKNIRINVDHIESYGTLDERDYDGLKPEYIGKTYIVPNGITEEFPYVVKESVQDIDRALDKLSVL